MAYVTRAEVKTYLGISGTWDDDLIDALISSATASLNSYLNVETLEAQTDASETYEHPVSDQNGGIATGRVFILKWPNPTDITTINGTSYTISTDFIFEGQRLVMKDALDAPTTFPYKHTIVYDYGYSTIPDAIKQAMYVIINKMRGEAKKSGDIQSFTQDKLSVTYGWQEAEYFTPEVKQLLRDYKRGSTEFSGVNIDTTPHTYPKL